MDLKEITHPTTFKVNGIFYRVTTYTKLTDEQAAKIVTLHLRSHKPKKKDKGKTITIKTIHDQSSADLL